jgi:N-acetylglucosamine kinase-like BadF-type ATPase
MTDGRHRLESDAAPLIFAAAEEGDAVEAGLVGWTGAEWGEMVNAVVRRLDFQALNIEVVGIGGMFAGGAALAEAMRRKVASLAPGARFIRLACPPAVGAFLPVMGQAGRVATIEVRGRLSREAAVQQ